MKGAKWHCLQNSCQINGDYVKSIKFENIWVVRKSKGNICKIGCMSLEETVRSK
jgi:hypothetical protein